MDRVCEEFHCVPSVARAELDADFEGVIDVLTCRHYARAKAAYDGMKDLTPEARAKVLADPMVQQVRETEVALAAEALARKREDADG